MQMTVVKREPSSHGKPKATRRLSSGCQSRDMAGKGMTPGQLHANGVSSFVLALLHIWQIHAHFR